MRNFEVTRTNRRDRNRRQFINAGLFKDILQELAYDLKTLTESFKNKNKIQKNNMNKVK